MELCQTSNISERLFVLVKRFLTCHSLVMLTTEPNAWRRHVQHIFPTDLKFLVSVLGTKCDQKFRYSISKILQQGMVQCQWHSQSSGDG